MRGGYSVKNGFYVKDDCKNNEADGSLDEDGYILDPLTYEKISEGNLIQLSDGLCYNKTKNLTQVIKKRNTLPYGHLVTSADKQNLPTVTSSVSSSPLQSLSLSDFDSDPLRMITSSLEESIPLELLESPSSEISIDSVSTPEIVEAVIPSSSSSFVIPPRPNISGFTAEWHPNTRSYILRREPTVVNRTRRPLIILSSDSSDNMEAQPVIIPAPRRRGRPLGSRNRTVRGNRTQSPLLVIESGSPNSMEAQPETIPAPRRRGRPLGSRNRASIRNAGRKNKTKRRKLIKEL